MALKQEEITELSAASKKALYLQHASNVLSLFIFAWIVYEFYFHRYDQDILDERMQVFVISFFAVKLIFGFMARQFDRFLLNPISVSRTSRPLYLISVLLVTISLFLMQEDERLIWLAILGIIFYIVTLYLSITNTPTRLVYVDDET